MSALSGTEQYLRYYFDNSNKHEPGTDIKRSSEPVQHYRMNILFGGLKVPHAG
jgi:hypothetical protein